MCVKFLYQVATHKIKCGVSEVDINLQSHREWLRCRFTNSIVKAEGYLKANKAVWICWKVSTYLERECIRASDTAMNTETRQLLQQRQGTNWLGDCGCSSENATARGSQKCFSEYLLLFLSDFVFQQALLCWFSKHKKEQESYHCAFIPAFGSF